MDMINFIIFAALLILGVWGLAYLVYRSDKRAKKS